MKWHLHDVFFDPTHWWWRVFFRCRRQAGDVTVSVLLMCAYTWGLYIAHIGECFTTVIRSAPAHLSLANQCKRVSGGDTPKPRPTIPDNLIKQQFVLRARNRQHRAFLEHLNPHWSSKKWCLRLIKGKSQEETLLDRSRAEDHDKNVKIAPPLKLIRILRGVG